MQPKIIKKSFGKNKESGCCFRSCGGMPVVQQDDSEKILKKSSIKKILKKIR